MIRVIFLICLCVTLAAHAQGQSGNGFDADTLANVQTEAIDFMLPRTLEVVTAAQLMTWSLAGLTSLDPALTTIVRETQIELMVHGHPTLDVDGRQPIRRRPIRRQPIRRAPIRRQPIRLRPIRLRWARAAAKIVAAAYAASPAMQQVGQAAVTKTLFDQMLAQLDPYSRYVPPMEAVGDRDRRVGHAGSV